MAALVFIPGFSNSRRCSKMPGSFEQEDPNMLEINLIVRRIKDMEERTATLRGYL